MVIVIFLRILVVSELFWLLPQHAWTWSMSKISLVLGFMSKEAKASISRWVWKSCQARPQSVCWRRDLIKSLHILHIWTDKVCTVENVLLTGRSRLLVCWCVLLVSIFELLMFISFALLYLFRTLVVQLCCSALAPKATCFIWFHLEPSPLKRMSKRLHRYFQKHQTNCSTYLIHFLIILHIHLCHFLCSYRKPLTSIHFLYSRIHSFLYFLLRSFIFFLFVGSLVGFGANNTIHQDLALIPAQPSTGLLYCLMKWFHPTFEPTKDWVIPIDPGARRSFSLPHYNSKASRSFEELKMFDFAKSKEHLK